jgi:hypothetical protein
MLTRPVSRAALLAAVLLTAAGCGSQAATPQAGAGPASPSAASPSPAPRGSSPAAPGPAPSATVTPGGPMIPPSPGGSCASQPMPRLGATITLHNSSNGGTFCVSIGQRVLVQLDSRPSRMWSPVRSDSRALVSLAYGDLMQRVGETGAIFAATHPGIAHLSSARPVCAGGPLHCDALLVFQVTVMVGGMQGSPVH